MWANMKFLPVFISFTVASRVSSAGCFNVIEVNKLSSFSVACS